MADYNGFYVKKITESPNDPKFVVFSKWVFGCLRLSLKNYPHSFDEGQMTMTLKYYFYRPHRFPSMKKYFD